MRRIAASALLFSLAVFVASLAGGPAFAQTTAGFGAISGVVTDQSGASVADAQVVIANESKGIHIELHTTAGGVFNAPALVPSSGYEVTVNKAGFSSYDVKTITLLVGQNLNLVAQLGIASTTTTVEVTAPLVDDTKTDVSGVIDSQQIINLPINGRRVDQFVLLTPGVTNDGNYGLLTFRGVANGNTFLLDGNDSTEQFYGENNGRTRVTSQISQDVVQEFQVVSSNFSAEYGRAMGGVVNTVTRSGTNEFHGTAYTFFRNQAMDAADPYSLGLNPNDWRSQTGASFGGPIIKDKLFFFVNGDFTRRNSPIVDTVQSAYVNSTTETFLPYNAASASLGCNSTVVQAGLPIATAAQCAAINPLLGRLFGNIPRTVDQDLGFGRLDYHLSDKNTFSVSLNFMHFKSPNGLQQTLITSTSGAGVTGNGNDFARVRNGKAEWTSLISPTIVNNFRYGWDTDLQGDNLNPALNGALGYLNVSLPSAVGVTLGSVNYLPRVEPNETRNEFADDLSWTRGRHIFKLGVDFATTGDYSYFIQNAHGQFSYSNLTTFALDFSGNTTGAKNWSSFSQTFGNPALNTRINDYDFYAQDQWRVTDKLTANVGLRYEYSHFSQPPRCNTAVPLTCHLNSPAGNVMPRIGLAYRLNNKTVLRGGYGLYYARMMGATLQDLYTGNGVTTTSISLTGSNPSQLAAGPVFPNILNAAPTAATQSAVNIQFANPNFQTPYSEQAVVGVERELTPTLALTVSGIWSRGIHLYSVVDTNLPTTAANVTYNIEDKNQNVVGTYQTPVLVGVGGVSGARPNHSFGGMYEDGNGVASFYDALAIQLNKRFSHGLQANLSYTWSHELDDGQGYGEETQNIYLSSASAWLINGNFRADYGDGLEDQPQRLAIGWDWTPTISRRDGAIYKYLVNNWELSSITTINSSRPYGNPTISDSSTAVVPGQFATGSSGSINGSGLSFRAPFLPENSVWVPAFYREDVRLSKILPFGERYKVFLNVEAFNLTNTWSPLSMRTGAYTESSSSCGAGKPTPCLIPVSSFNTGNGDGMNPDGTEARRFQVSARFTF